LILKIIIFFSPNSTLKIAHVFVQLNFQRKLLKGFLLTSRYYGLAMLYRDKKWLKRLRITTKQNQEKDLLRITDSNPHFTLPSIIATLQVVMLIFYSTCLLSCLRADGLLLLPTSPQKVKIEN
jgi:hypothetical protein